MDTSGNLQVLLLKIALFTYFKTNILGHTKLLPWSSDFLFENKERASKVFIFVQKISYIILWSERMFFFIAK